jgi:hypothetical protein
MVLTPTAGRGDPLSSPARPRRPVNGPSHRLLAAFRSSTPPPVAQSAQPAESAIYARIHAAANIRRDACGIKKAREPRAREGSS